MSSTNKSVLVLLFILLSPTYLNFAFAEHPIPKDHQILDQHGNSIFIIKTGQIVQIQNTVTSIWDEEKNFVYLVQIIDQGITTQLSWITGNLFPKQTLNVSQSWIPERPGIFTIQVFVWDQLMNPTALFPVTSTTLEVQLDSSSISIDPRLTLFLDNHKGNFTEINRCFNCYDTGWIRIDGNRTFSIGLAFISSDTGIREPVFVEVMVLGASKIPTESYQAMTIDKFTLPESGTSIGESIIKSYDVSSPYIAVSISYFAERGKEGSGLTPKMENIKTTLWLYTAK